MPIKVDKQNKESSQLLVRRFTQKLRQSGLLLEIKKRQFRKRIKSKQMQKFSAIRRAGKKAEIAEKQKMAG